MSDVQPAPAPAPAPSTNWSVILPVVSSLVSLFLVLGCVCYLVFFRSTPQPVDPSLVAAAKTYVKTLPDAYASASAQVKNGTLTDKAAVVDALKSHAKPLATALDTTFSPLIDSNGKITNVTEAANALEQVSKGLGGK